MSLMQISNIYKSFSGETLFKDISFNINEKDKIGLIGINGAGKSTLIKILLGQEEPDINPITHKLGTITKASDLKVGYLSQHSDLNPNNNVLEELLDTFGTLRSDYNRIAELTKILMSDDNENLHHELADLISSYEEKGGYTTEYKIKKVLNDLEFEENLWENKIATLSGGQQTKISLCKILLDEPTLLILDEPTNHLDLEAIEWLESFLKNYKQSFLLISHDKYFLDNTVNRIFEIEAKYLKIYKGNYTDFTIQKEIFLSGALKSFEQEQEKIKKLEEFVAKYKAGQKSKQARGRQKFLDRMDRAENPTTNIKTMSIQFKIDTPSTKKVLEIKDLTKSFSNNLLFQNFNLSLEKGERVALIGRNGVGKSTILKIINNLENYDSGVVEFGEKLKIGYYDQHHQGLYLKNTVLEEIISNFDIKEEEARGYLGQFLFSQDDVFKQIQSLSGGERARVSLLKLILSKPNFLILDEPTNHLDIYSREILESAFDSFEGTMLVVSHDRHFLNTIVDKLCIIDKTKTFYFDGSYDEYVEQRDVNIVKPAIKKVVNISDDKKVKEEISALQKENMSLEKKLKKLDSEEKQLQAKLEKAGVSNNLEELISLQTKIEDINEQMLQIIENIDNNEKRIVEINS
ncbi:MAG: ATP-binding cassette domain-containing protein [Alphaproteobacteria bacterium]|jgi:ATP-binding cassette subfamily F protein 3|nr:ATP-binding cassette domain-containing protein [Alphaproteobacteria bacterium]